MKISGTRMMSLPILLALSVPAGATSYTGTTIETEQAILAESHAASMTPAETIVLRGRVIDTNGDALPGVTVQMAGKSTGVVTDTNGKFSISLPKGQSSTIVFSYIGMKNETYTCNGKKDANVVIRMQEDASQINEVVVVCKV